MSFGDHIAAQFPHVKWTGQSHIHRSLAGDISMKKKQNQSINQIMSDVHHSAIGLALWDFLLGKFGDMDWQVSAEEFRAIILVDVARHLNHEGDTQDPTKIKNPNTGNVFHRLAIRGDIVGGVRIWHQNELTFGFRFRLAQMSVPDKQHVPVIARQKAISSIKMQESVIKKYTIAEPSVEEVKKLRESVHVK